jgi:hypothetical protein
MNRKIEKNLSSDLSSFYFLLVFGQVVGSVSILDLGNISHDKDTHGHSVRIRPDDRKQKTDSVFCFLFLRASVHTLLNFYGLRVTISYQIS